MPTSQVEFPTQNARQDGTGHGVRYALAFGLALAVCAMLLVPFVAH